LGLGLVYQLEQQHRVGLVLQLLVVEVGLVYLLLALQLVLLVFPEVFLVVLVCPVAVQD
jgi:hypothetical protein